MYLIHVCTILQVLLCLVEILLQTEKADYLLPAHMQPRQWPLESLTKGHYLTNRHHPQEEVRQQLPRRRLPPHLLRPQLQVTTVS